MKKSKFLLLGSLSSLAAIPFVAAKCGDTKEEENKKPAETPSNTDQPGKPSNTDQPGKPGDTDQPAKPSETEQPAKPNMENLGNFMPDPSRHNSVSQKKIKDKIEKMLGTKDFHLNVDYNKNVAKVTTKDKVILYKFTTYSRETRPANNTDEIGTDIGRLLPKYE
nr:variable surface lipoprotein [Mycoplasmopsis agalactiae]